MKKAAKMMSQLLFNIPSGKAKRRDIAKDAAMYTAKALTTNREAIVHPKSVLDIIELIEGKVTFKR